uniref:Reverse transcriptase domain-containing protein n=1 Tax=Tanacetum cinerariifolium TaxID=118510 RepID=A0A699HB04_TANCI|nr:reverse transcriptase domain-containing protein [Tanacetum cinerariifolium]
MADNQTMEELLQAPTEGCGEAIVIPKINADHYEIKMNLLQLVQANLYHGFERENPHTHINNFKRITSTLKFRDVPNDVLKLMMFPYSLEGYAKVWYDKDPPNSILTWEDLVNKFVNQFFPPSKTTTSKMKSLILLKDSRRHLERHGNDLRKCLERGKSSKTDDRIDKLGDSLSTLVDIFAKKVVNAAPVKVVKESCVTCGGPHAHYNCDATNSNQPSICVATAVDFEADPRIPLILGRSLLRTGRALIDVYGEEITLREYAQEILSFSNNSLGGNPNLTSEPTPPDSSPTLTPFEGSDFILEAIEAYLKDESVSLEINHAGCDPEGDICLIEKLLNNDPF